MVQDMVCKCDFASEPLDKISDQHAQHFAAKYAPLSASRINCGLRSLRRALNLAFEWGKLNGPLRSHWRKAKDSVTRVLTRMATGSGTSRIVRNLGMTLRLSFAAQECALAKRSRFDGRISI